jgi:hypothetical protein
MAILKNTTIVDTSALTLPSGTTAQRPALLTNGMVRFNATIGAVESYVNGAWREAGRGIPLGAMLVELWGAGGGGSAAGGWNQGANGGAGGYTWGYLTDLTPGEALVLIVGQGGVNYGTTNMFGGGAPSSTNGSDNRYGAAGGGLTGLFRGSYSFANALLIAGGGGGGGNSRAGNGNVGGAGGGNVGQDGESPYDNKFGHRGRAASRTAAGENASSDLVNAGGQQGQLQGGSSRGNSYGGGGGSGYWGGSGGGYSESNTMAGGGGGSGYVHPTLVKDGATITGIRRTPAVIVSGQTFGFGGVASNTQNGAGNPGGNGFARITKNGTTTSYTYTGSNINLTF